jgi:hypothetical protein
MRTMRMERKLWSALVLLGALGCGGDAHSPTEPTGPIPGVLKVSLVTPNADDGAVLFTISGAPVASIETPSPSYHVYAALPDTNTARVLVTGDLAAGAVALIHVADTRRAAAYHATIAQAASRATFAQRTLSGYSFTVAP